MSEEQDNLKRAAETFRAAIHQIEDLGFDVYAKGSDAEVYLGEEQLKDVVVFDKR